MLENHFGAMDSWNPNTFDVRLLDVLNKSSELIAAYHREDRRLMDEHLNSEPYESLKSNQYASEYLSLREYVIAPLMKEQRIRVWHYTRLTNDEAVSIKRKLEPSTLAGLRGRLDMLIQQSALTQDETDIIYRESPFHAQEKIRSNRFFSVNIPLPPDDHGVEPLLTSWGGESSYFGLSDKTLAVKLKTIGIPRIIEIETALRDRLNAFSVAETVIQSWANYLKLPVLPLGTDLAITNCLMEARVLKVHTKGDGIFETVGRDYPDGVAILQEN